MRDKFKHTLFTLQRHTDEIRAYERQDLFDFKDKKIIQVEDKVLTFSFGETVNVESFSNILDKNNIKKATHKSLEEPLMNFTLANHNNKDVYLVGGTPNKTDPSAKSCYTFNIQECNDPEKAWRRQPDMNFGRCMSATVILQEKLFAISGFDNRNTCQTAEFLDLSKPEEERAWELIVIATNEGFTFRQSVMAAPISKTEILIAGGLSTKSGGYDDAWIYDIERKVAIREESKNRGTQFITHSPTIVTNEGEIASLVQIMRPQEQRGLQIIKADKYLNVKKVDKSFPL